MKFILIFPYVITFILLIYNMIQVKPHEMSLHQKRKFVNLTIYILAALAWPFISKTVMTKNTNVNRLLYVGYFLIIMQIFLEFMSPLKLTEYKKDDVNKNFILDFTIISSILIALHSQMKEYSNELLYISVLCIFIVLTRGETMGDSVPNLCLVASQRVAWVYALSIFIGSIPTSSS